MAKGLRGKVLQAVLEAGPGGATLTEVARSIGSQGPPVLHHLRNLVIEGRVARIGQERGPRYAAQPGVRIEWLDPRARRAWSWECRTIDWRYPLASRVPDALAQESIALLLRMADEEGIFQGAGKHGPRRSHKRGPPAGGGIPPSEWFGVRVFAYGSCARGDASPRSDVDLLWLLGPGAAFKDDIQTLSAEASLVTPRNVDSKAVPAQDYGRLPERLREALSREALIVFSSYAGGESEPLPREAR